MSLLFWKFTFLQCLKETIRDLLFKRRMKTHVLNLPQTAVDVLTTVWPSSYKKKNRLWNQMSSSPPYSWAEWLDFQILTQKMVFIIILTKLATLSSFRSLLNDSHDDHNKVKRKVDMYTPSLFRTHQDLKSNVTRYTWLNICFFFRDSSTCNINAIRATRVG